MIKIQSLYTSTNYRFSLDSFSKQIKSIYLPMWRLESLCNIICSPRLLMKSSFTVNAPSLSEVTAKVWHVESRETTTKRDRYIFNTWKNLPVIVTDKKNKIKLNIKIKMAIFFHIIFFCDFAVSHVTQKAIFFSKFDQNT